MIARLLKLLLLLQLLALAGLYRWFVHTGGMAPAAALVLACGVLLGLRALITAHNFGLSRRYGSATPAEYAPRLALRVRLFIEEFFATMLASSWTMLWPRVGWRIAPDPVGLPVLLIHGYVCNSGYWLQLSRRLRRARISHYGLDLEPPGAAIEDYAPQVEAAVEELRRRTGSARIVIVAHSMGGLVARAWLRAYGGTVAGEGGDMRVGDMRVGDMRVARVITLATPHHGTGLASFGPGRNAAQMRRTSRAADGLPGQWLSALATTESIVARTLFTSIFSHHDNIVAPQTSAYLPHAKNLEFGAIGHVAIGRDRRVLDCVLDEIALASRPPAPAPAPRH